MYKNTASGGVVMCQFQVLVASADYNQYYWYLWNYRVFSWQSWHTNSTQLIRPRFNKTEVLAYIKLHCWMHLRPADDEPFYGWQWTTMPQCERRTRRRLDCGESCVSVSVVCDRSAYPSVCWFCCLLLRFLVHFYPRDAMLARVIEIATCPSVRPSVMRRYCVKTKKASGIAAWFLHHLVAPRL